MEKLGLGFGVGPLILLDLLATEANGHASDFFARARIVDLSLRWEILNAYHEHHKVYSKVIYNTGDNGAP